MQLEAVILDESGVRRFERLNRASPHGTVFGSPSWHDYIGNDYRTAGVYKGAELIAGCVVPTAGGRVLSVVPQTPWTGISARSEDEGENLAIASSVAELLRREWGEAALTLPPAWRDVRGFLWDGWRSHVRYTYRGEESGYEKRVKVRPAIIHRLKYDSGNEWGIHKLSVGDSWASFLYDWNTVYYWQSNEGGSWHTELIDKAMKDECESTGRQFDMVGCNSPHRALFKRSFGLRLTPYYHVTTGDPAGTREFWGERSPIERAA